jgi:hypothetical protein
MRKIHSTFLSKSPFKMRRSFFALLFVGLTINVSGQAPFPNKDEIKQFTASKTCVVLEDKQFSPYNSFIKKAVKEFWTVTPYEFIAVSEFNLRRVDPGYSFIVLTQTNYEKDKSNGLFNYINLLQGKAVDNLSQLPEICAVPLSFAGEDDLEYGYKLGSILLFMQKHALMISEDPSLTGRKYLKYYNKYIPEVKSKTILVKEEDLAPSIASIDMIRAIYSGKIKIVTEEDIVEAVVSKAPNTLILHKVGPVGEINSGYCFKMLIGTDDAGMYYYNQHVIDKANPNGLLPADLKRLAR